MRRLAVAALAALAVTGAVGCRDVHDVVKQARDVCAEHDGVRTIHGEHNRTAIVFCEDGHATDIEGTD